MIVQWVPTRAGVEAPRKAYDGDAGFDLICQDTVVFEPGETKDVSSDIAVAMPRGWYGRIVGRSSTMRKRGLLVIEGVIDYGFRGELFTCVHNPQDIEVVVLKGTSLAQLLFLPVLDAEWEAVPSLPESERGTAGFGSSGDAGASTSSTEQYFCPDCGPEIASEQDALDWLSDGKDARLRELTEWWISRAEQDAAATLPKVLEYGGEETGSADLRVMGYALAELAGAHDIPEPVKLEMGVWFYALGKVSRLISDYKRGGPGKSDTWFDLQVYATMARRIQETGEWP